MERISQNDIFKIKPAEPHTIRPDSTTVQTKENEATTPKAEVDQSDDGQHTTQAYKKKHAETESTQSNEKLLLETIFGQSTTEKIFQFDSMDGTPVRYGNEQIKGGNSEKYDDDSMENEILEMTTHQPAQDEFATEHRNETETVVPEHEIMVAIPQKNSQEEERLPGIFQATSMTSQTNVEKDMKAENEISSKNKDQIHWFDHLTNQSKPTHQPTPPPVAVERDESITESFNQEMDPTFDPVEPISTIVFDAELEATTVSSSRIDPSAVRPDEKGNIDFDKTFQTTKKHEDTTNRFIDKLPKPNSVQKYEPEVTTSYIEKSGSNTEVPSHSSHFIDETTTLLPIKKYPEPLSSDFTDALIERATYVISSKQEDSEITTEKINASEQEDVIIVTSTLGSEKSIDQKGISSESTNVFTEEIQDEHASTVQSLLELTTTRSIDFKQNSTEVSISIDSELGQSSTLQDKQNLIENQTANSEPGSQQNYVIGEKQPTTINIFVNKSTQEIELSTEVESLKTETTKKQETESQEQFVPSGDIQSSIIDFAATTEMLEPTTSVYNVNRIGDYESEQDGFTTEKSDKVSIVQNKLQPSNEGTEHDILTSFNKMQYHVEITTLGNVEKEITTSELSEATKEASIEIINEQTENNVEHSHYDENQFDKRPSAGHATTLTYVDHMRETTPTNLITTTDYSDNIFKLEETSRASQGTENITEEVVSSDKYITSQTLLEESSTYSFASYSPVKLAPELPKTTTAHDQSEITTLRQQGIDMIETQTNRGSFDQKNSEDENNITSVIPDVAVQKVIETTASPNNVSGELIISYDEYPHENTGDPTLTESTIVEKTTPKNVVELLTTWHPVSTQQFESASIESTETGSTESPETVTEVQDRTESNEFTTLRTINTDDQNINAEFSKNDENKTASATTAAPQENVKVPPESANNIPLIRDPLPNRFDGFTTKLAESFYTTTLPSILFSHTYSDSTTVRNTPFEITEPSTHISKGPLTNQMEHTTESQPHEPSYSQPQAPTYDNSGTYPSQYPDEEYTDEDEPAVFGPGTCRYGGKLYVSAQQIPRDDSCDFCFCFRSDIICLQQSCPPPIVGCREEPISGFCCPRYECPVPMALVNHSTTTTTTTLPPYLSHFQRNSAKFTRSGCQVQGITYKIGERVTTASGPCIDCICGGDGQMKCDPKVCTPEPMLRQMIATATTRR